MPTSAADYVAELKKTVDLTANEEAILIEGGIRSDAALLGLTYAFPRLAAQLNLDFPKLSFAATQGLALGQASVISFARRNLGQGVLPIPSLGALPPPTAPVQLGAVVPLLSGAPAAGPLTGVSSQNVDRPLWKVRDQNPRGTCVAFATTALREFAEFLTGKPESLDLSEQFLYWAIKQQPGEPWPTTDGTTLDYAQRAVANNGICDCSLWPYVRMVIPGNPGQGAAGIPSAAAVADANTRRMTGSYTNASGMSGRAQHVYNLLATKSRPVAIAVPVFGDPHTNSNTWSTLTGWQYGEVLNPLPALVNVGGHAVAVTGFRPDASEPSGGYFIFRNSWSTAWGSLADVAPTGQLASGRKGYGIISATYIDKYLYETLVL